MKLHDYQKRGAIKGFRDKIQYYALDTGLGKTAIILHILKHLKKKGIKAIIFAPIPVIYNTWPQEILDWKIDLSWEILHGPDKNYRLQETNPDIFLINYEGLKWFKKAVLNKKIKWEKRALVLDESSMIKSPSTVRFKTLKKLFPLWHDYRYCLSATPAPNGYQNLWSQYFMLDKGEKLLPSYYKFRGRFFNYTGPPLFKTTLRPGQDKIIQKQIAPMTFRLDANDYLTLPKEIYNNIPLTLSDEMMQLYKRLEKDFFLEFENSDATALSAAALSMKLRQFIQGAIYTDAGNGAYEVLHKTKLEALKSFMETASGNPILCAIQFRFELDMITKAFKFEVPYIAGGIGIKRANYLIREWNKGKIPFLLCHPASISHGVNLQFGGYNLLWYGLTWSLGHYIQLIGRLSRQKQKSDRVIISHFLLKNTIDERLSKIIQQKGITQTNLLNALKNF